MNELTNTKIQGFQKLLPIMLENINTMFIMTEWLDTNKKEQNWFISFDGDNFIDEDGKIDINEFITNTDTWELHPDEL